MSQGQAFWATVWADIARFREDGLVLQPLGAGLIVPGSQALLAV